MVNAVKNVPRVVMVYAQISWIQGIVRNAGIDVQQGLYVAIRSVAQSLLMYRIVVGVVENAHHPIYVVWGDVVNSVRVTHV